jgi:hypothetical protein
MGLNGLGIFGDAFERRDGAGLQHSSCRYAILEQG